MAQPQKPSDDQILAKHMVDDSWKQPDPQDSDDGGFGLEWLYNSGMIGGGIAMAVGLLAFFGIWAAGYIFPYALILFAIGLAAFIRGIWEMAS